jgi:hypothetical protein
LKKWEIAGPRSLSSVSLRRSCITRKMVGETIT